ncbi:unnamed protein product, partial [Phaeothamnion confervicola]
MYIDAGYAPDHYFRYDHHFAPAAEEVVNWIAAHDGRPWDIRVPVSPLPPLPAAVACLAMMPLRGQALVAPSLAPLMASGSPVAALFQPAA